MISVVLPTKNEEKCIGRTLKQFKTLKKKFNLEVIVSDAGSSDATIKIAKKYADTVVVHKKKTRQNIPQGRNAGAYAAKGDIIVQFDADIRIGKDGKIFKRINEAFEDKKIVGATANVKIYPEELIWSDRIAQFILDIVIKILTLFGSSAARGECQIFRKSTFKKIGGYNEKFNAGEDYDLFARLKKVGKIKFFHDVTIYGSPRRFRKEGYIKIFWVYFLNYWYNLFFKRSYSKEWKEVR